MFEINKLHKTYHINFHFGFWSNELFQSQSIGNREVRTYTRIPGQPYCWQSDQRFKKIWFTECFCTGYNIIYYVFYGFRVSLFNFTVQYFKGLKKRMLSCLTRKCWGMFTVHVTWTCLSTCYEKTSRTGQIWREIFTWNLSNICPDKNLHFKKIFSKFRENI